nr:2Fe-2S iron-sulfur cluster-binding protein [uncultured Cohaesibacter sp.]
MTKNRLPSGGLINRQQPIRFQFNGRHYMGYEGDTLASALLANDIHMVGRSFKYGRPRGIMAAGPEEPNAIVQLNRSNRTEPATKATEVALRSSLVANPVTAWPSLEYDLKSLNHLMQQVHGSRLLLQDHVRI